MCDFESNAVLGETNSLYTARGEQGMGTSQSMIDDMKIFLDTEEEMNNRVKWHYIRTDYRLFGQK